MRYSKRVAAIAVVTSLIAVACGDDDEESGTEATTADTSASSEAPAPGETTPAATTGDGGGGEGLLGGEIPCDNQYEGKTVSLFSPVRNSENDPTAVEDFTSYFQPFMDCTGVTIEFQGSDQFETEINVRIQGGSPPDVIDFPQPGLLRTLATSGGLIPFPDNVAAHVTADMIPGWPELGTVDGEVYGMPWRANVKSLVWYSPAMFEAGGYEIPETLGELTALSDQIVADGGIPWCAGIESGVATGWPITDWFEDFMLRLNGPDVYDQWVNHEIPFNDPQVLAVAEAVGAILKNPDYIGGDNAVKAIATTKFQDGGVPIASGDCYMHRQASFYNTLFPEGTTVGPPGSDSDVTFFYLPVAEAGDPKVMLGAGDINAAGTDKPETWDTILYASSNEYAIAMANGHSELSPRTDIDASLITDPMLASFAELLASSEIFRFDGADMMPGAVGSGTFWTEATAWIVGGDTETMLDNIEASWPA
ncbi:MAG TPA: ABC transporter substrate-binding protein [Ilumatobacteraceae bacterium]|nr:ABC transporter substrate-binding protein [Ilumatobacteraceae bacterium]